MSVSMPSRQGDVQRFSGITCSRPALVIRVSENCMRCPRRGSSCVSASLKITEFMQEALSCIGLKLRALMLAYI